MNRFSDKTILVIGATSGMGLCIAEQFAKEGAKVITCGRREALGTENALKMCNSGLDVAFYKLDATDSGEVKTFFSMLESKYDKLDIAVNAQGWNTLDKISLLEPSTFDSIIKVNLNSYFYCIKYETQLMQKNNKGAIVNISSVNAVLANNYQAAYCAAKAGMEQLSKVAALEFGPCNIRVNCIEPGLTDTDMAKGIIEDKRLYDAFMKQTPLRTHGKVNDIASAVLFLASDDASFINGVSLPVDGGLVSEGFPDVFRIFKGEEW